jgi:DedD protein
MSREAELYKDKIEVSLDGRQIFYLFFGGAVIVGLVFVLGVMVGRRVEARGHVDHARTPAATDPLAALDRLENKGGLSFQGALTGNQAPSDVEKAIDELEKARAKTPAPVAPSEPAPAPKPAKVEAKAAPKAEPKAEVKAEPKPEKPAKSDDGDSKAAKASAPSEGAVTKPEQATEPRPKVRYTLQLSSFQDKNEAEAFLAQIKATGYQPHMTEAEVSGKTFYRVRLGTYRSLETANNAKADFEKSSKKSASIMRL